MTKRKKNYHNHKFLNMYVRCKKTDFGDVAMEDGFQCQCGKKLVTNRYDWEHATKENTRKI